MNINSSLKNTPIAVIGMSAMFADAKNIEEFWSNILDGKNSITDVPANRWLIEDYYDEDFSAPDKTYCKRGGFLPEIDFDPLEFGLPPNILEVTDASQLLGLVAARDALIDAGYGRDSSKFTKELKEKTGVLLGVGGGQKLITPLIARLQYPIWKKALKSSGIADEDIPPIIDKMKKAYVGWNENSFPGLLGNVISGRITNRFDLGGINSVVDAACAASLSAIKMSLSELIEGRCDMMLTGGVDTDNSPFMYMSFSKTPAFSKSGNISPYSDKADGMLIGEGLGMLVLRRLEDAERDGDKIYAVIKGVGTSSDGRYKSVYAPRPAGQALAMERAYEDAGFSASTVGLLEGHGTGTGAGDPTEFTSMNMVFSKNNPNKKHIALGSVKSQIGHTKAAAGAAGIIKTVLALHHKVLPTTINVEQPNKKFNIEESPIYINTETRPWIKNGNPRRAGVSAFGFGGINVHIVLEEYLGQKSVKNRINHQIYSIILQGSSKDALKDKCLQISADLSTNDGEALFNKLVKQTIELDLIPGNPRLGITASNLMAFSDLLKVGIGKLDSNEQNWSHPNGIFYRSKSLNLSTNKIVGLFAGQGSQYIGMGKDLAVGFPEMLDSFQQNDELFSRQSNERFSDKIFPNPTFNQLEKDLHKYNLNKTEYAQPAIGTLSMGQFKILRKAGFKPDFVAGHSYGELTALWASGAFDEETFLLLSQARGKAMAAKSDHESGTMVAVRGGSSEVEKIISDIPQVIIANINAPDQVVLGGSESAIKVAVNKLKSAGIDIIPLSVSAAFHTDYVKHAQKPFSKFLKPIEIGIPTIPVYANSTGNPYPGEADEIKKILKNQILNPVLFQKQIENIYEDGGRIFVEFGPKGILSNLVNKILKGKEHITIALNPSPTKNGDLQLRQAALQLKILGLPLDIVDPSKNNFIVESKGSKLTVKLSGNNFVSKVTKQAYQDSLNNGFKIGSIQNEQSEKRVHQPSSPINQINLETAEDMLNKEALQLLKSTLESFQSNQTKSLEVFEKFLSDQNKQSNFLLELLSNQLSSKESPAPHKLTSNGSAGTGIRSTKNGSHIANELHSDETIDKLSEPHSKEPIHSIETSAPEFQKVSTETVPQTDLGKLSSILLEVISEKTGYPAEMLELNMDMEADLGIDSIKRVEIFGSLTQQYPEMSNINPNELTELRTLQEIVDHVSNITNLPAPDKVSVVQETTQSQIENTQAPAVVTETAIEVEELSSKLLNVVSEKTGYPAEMLELNMDMEADLGIDSIKRVEIFGSLTQQYPEMSGINPNDLTELRTLQEIVDHVSKNMGVKSAPETNLNDSPEIKESDHPENDSKEESLKTQLLEVVSDKTGYPAEMLELSMDMEADLGIDSIKRVEIFGSLTQKNPELSGINPNELTELRTLQEIVDYVKKNSKKKVLV